MTRLLTRLTFSWLAAALAGCAAGNTFAPAASPAAPAAPAMRGRAHALIVRIRIPRHRRRGRGARYISAGTKGMTLAITGASTLNEAIDLTPNDPRCTGTTLVCTIAVPLAPGAYNVAVTTYDLAPVGGAIPAGAHQLSIAPAMPLTVAPAKVNNLNVTLDGVPASIVVGPVPQGILGTAFLATSFPVVVKDADGYTIVGTYSTPIVLTDSDTSGITTVTTAGTGSDHPAALHLLSSSDVASIAYNGKAVAPVTIGASAGIITASANFTASMPLYASDTSGNTVKLLTGSCTTDSCGTTIGSGFSHPVGLALDASGNLFVADFLNNAVKEIPAGGGTIRTLGSGFSNPADVAVDSNGNVFVSDNGNYRVAEIVAVDGVIPASPTITRLGGFSSPFEIALDSSGDVFVADAGGNAVREIEAVDGVIPMSPTIATIGSGFNGPSGVVVDGAGNVFVADIGNHAVKEVLTGTTTVITLSDAFGEPYYVKLDQAGNLYASDNSSGAITKFAAVNGSIPASPTLSTFASGFNGITGFVVPR